jgi:hypothetical protein
MQSASPGDSRPTKQAIEQSREPKAAREGASAATRACGDNRGIMRSMAPERRLEPSPGRS